MHILGKVFVWLALLGVVPAVLLSVKVLSVQNSWTKKVEDARTQNQQRAEALEKKEAELKNLQLDLSIANVGLEKFWVGQNRANQPISVSVQNRQTGELIANLGTNDGIVPFQAKDENGAEATINPTLHAFRPEGPNAMVYVGAFQVQNARENDCVMVPMWRLQPGETDQWQGGLQWHFRSDIPVAFKTRFDNLYADLESATRSKISGSANLTQQQEAFQDADTKLTEWEGQLVGPQNPPAEPSLPAEFRIGLVPAIEEQETLRNHELAELDRLRHLLKRTSDLLQQLNQENAGIVEKAGSTERPAVSSR